jgi:hypothetical protein
VSDRINALVDAMKPADLAAMTDSLPSQTTGSELVDRDDAFLRSGNLGYLPVPYCVVPLSSDL